MNGVGICLRNGSFPSDIGIVKFYPSKGTHWVCYINVNYSDSYGCVPPNKLYEIFRKTKGTFFIFRIQKTRSNKQTRFLVCFLLFKNNLQDKSVRN